LVSFECLDDDDDVVDEHLSVVVVIQEDDDDFRRLIAANLDGKRLVSPKTKSRVDLS
jgi:hypothetical protein